MAKLVYTVDEAADVLGIGRTSAYEAVRRGEIPSIRVGRRLMVPKAQLDRLLSGDDRTRVSGPLRPDGQGGYTVE